MILVSILIMIKALLFLSATFVEHDAFLVFLVTSGVSILLIAIISFSNLKEKTKNILLTILYSLISLVLLIDVMHYSYFGSLPSVRMLSQAGQLTDVTDSVKSLLTFKNLLFAIDIPFVIYYIFKINKEKDLEFTKRMKIGIPVGIFIGLAVIVGIAANSGRINSLQHQEPFFFHSKDIKNYIKGIDGNEIEGSLLDKKDAIEEIISRREFKEGNYTGIGKDKNLIVLQVEALQNFVINLEYNGQEVTPNLNKLIKDSGSIYYDNYFQLLGRGNTSDAEFVTNNSLHPSMQTPTYDQYGENTFYGLPWVLRDNDYSVWAFHGYKRDFWSRSKAYPNQGYERFIAEDDFEFEDKDIIGLGISDELFFEQTIDYLKELDSIDDNPFYAFVVSLTSHNPFEMPEEYNVLDILPEHEDTILGDYIQSIHYTDKYIGKFIEDLKKEGLYDDTVIALYGDHFAIQSTTQDIADMMTDFLGREYHFDDIMNIPLVIHVPGEEINHTNSKVGSQLDFYPTILNIMGYENNKGIIFGRDLNNYEGYNNVKPQTIMRKGSLVDEDVILMMSKTEIFDQSTAYDRKTRKQVEIDKYRDIYEEAILELNLSDMILKNDLLKSYMANGGRLDLDSVEVAKLETINKFKKSSATNIQELELELEDSPRIISITRKPDEEIYINDLFKFKELADWNEDKENIRVLITTDHENLNEIYNRTKFLFPRSKAEYLVQIKNFDSHYFVTQYGFENIILNIKDSDYKADEILDFVNVHSVYGVVLDPVMYESNLIKELQLQGINVYVEVPAEVEVEEEIKTIKDASDTVKDDSSETEVEDIKVEPEMDLVLYRN